MSNRRTPLRCIAGVFLAAILAGTVHSQEKRNKPVEPDLNELNMEVTALQTLFQFNFTHEQMTKLLPWAKEAAQPQRKRAAARTTKEYAAKLQELRDALAGPADNDKVDRLNEELDELRDADEPSFDDGVDITEAARKRAPEAFRQLKVTQLSSFISQVADNVPDPAELLLESFKEVRALKAAAWREKRDALADEVSRLLAGVDADKADRKNDEVAALLLRVRRLSDDEFARERANLEKDVRKIVGDLGPDQVLRNFVEHELATLLSNPQTHAALSAHLQSRQPVPK